MIEFIEFMVLNTSKIEYGLMLWACGLMTGFYAAKIEDRRTQQANAEGKAH